MRAGAGDAGAALPWSALRLVPGCVTRTPGAAENPIWTSRRRGRAARRLVAQLLLVTEEDRPEASLGLPRQRLDEHELRDEDAR